MPVADVFVLLDCGGSNVQSYRMSKMKSFCITGRRQ
jgi:hypothetical protein